MLGMEAPYPVYDLPVVLGTIGGIGLLVGPAGLLHAKWRRGPILKDESRTGMDVAFLVMLWACRSPKAPVADPTSTGKLRAGQLLRRDEARAQVSWAISPARGARRSNCS